jgi:hypothetical protein
MRGTRRPFRVAAATVAVALWSAAGCSGDASSDAAASDPPAPAVPWSVADELAASRRGEYRKVLVVSSGTQALPLLEEWVAFDLDGGVVERTIVVGVGRDGRPDESVSRENPSLRFVYTRDTSYMWAPWTEASCGAAWVEMTPEMLARETGLEVGQGDLLIVEPLDILRSADPGELVSTTERSGLYEATVPGGTGLGLSSLVAIGPDVRERILDQEHPAEIRLARDGGEAEIRVDLDEVAAEVVSSSELDAGDEIGMTMQWTVTTAPEVAAPTVPSDVAGWAACEEP